MTVDSILLQVGLEVSAKFKGAFCEAKIKSVDPNVKLKIRFQDGKVIDTSHKNCVGNITSGGKVYFHSKMGVIIRLKDCSTYTVVFDDGDEKTLKRGSLCIKGQRHFDESVTLDSLPLTDPEHFGNNVQVSKDVFASGIFTTDDTHTDNDDETDQSGSSIEVKSEDHKLLEEKPRPIEVKKECPIKTEDTPSTSSIPEPKFKPEILIDDKETSEQLMKKLNKEFSLDEKELRELDGPEERINMIEFHLIFLSNKYQDLKAELTHIDRIRKKRKLKTKDETEAKEPKIS